MEKRILVYGDSLSWGIIPGTRNRYDYDKRWPGILDNLLGKEYRVIEECLNGRTTAYEDPTRPSRNGQASIRMIMESHSPLDLVIVFLGINDFQDLVGSSAESSAANLVSICRIIQAFIPEPMTHHAKCLAIVPPDIEKPRGLMADKFSQFQSLNVDAEQTYRTALESRGIDYILFSTVTSLSIADGIHLDEEPHRKLAQAVYDWVAQYFGKS